MNALSLRWGDLAIAGVASVVVAASFALAYTPDQPARMLVVTRAGEPPRHEPLDRVREVTFEGPAGMTRVAIEPGRARCADSPGHQDICEASGWLERDGDIAVSLPNRLTLRVHGGAGGYDSIHY
ncbi:MAG: NusG domain II-containing protein [Pseudomonadota bacterium]